MPSKPTQNIDPTDKPKRIRKPSEPSRFILANRAEREIKALDKAIATAEKRLAECKARRVSTLEALPEEVAVLLAPEGKAAE